MNISYHESMTACSLYNPYYLSLPSVLEAVTKRGSNPRPHVPVDLQLSALLLLLDHGDCRKAPSGASQKSH